MKKTLLGFVLIGATALYSHAQNQVTDTHPAASIAIIDYQTGQTNIAVNNDAILFKDAFIDLVINSNTARQMGTKAVPGRKTFTITQVNTDETGNSYQLLLGNRFLGQSTTLYTFLYNVDQNTLYYFSPNQQTWVPETVVGSNLSNLNNCYAFSKFNDPPQDANANNNQQPTDEEAVNNTPVDVDVSTRTVPPPLPEYEQPECPTDGYLWQPGYWAYNGTGYYWVPGVWIAPPDQGYLWTPPYWGYSGGLYLFHGGYWGTSIGFYGGINYGYGYRGSGFVGGEWYGGHYRYNTAVVRVNTTVVHNTYVNRTVINNTVINNNRASFNGQGGVVAKPTQTEASAMKQPHIAATPAQINNQRVARADKSQFAAENNGKPANLAVAKAPAVPQVTRNPGTQQLRRPSQNTHTPGQNGGNGTTATSAGRQNPAQNAQAPGRTGNNGTNGGSGTTATSPGRQNPAQNAQTPGKTGNNGTNGGSPGKPNQGQTFTSPGRASNNGAARQGQSQPGFNRTIPNRQPQNNQRQPSRPSPAPQREESKKKS